MKTTVLAVLLATAAPGVALSQDDAEPTEFTATWKFTGDGGTGDMTVADGVYQDRRRVHRTDAATASDPRFAGTVTIELNTDKHGLRGPAVARGTIRVENDGGAWVDEDVVAFGFSGRSGPEETGVLIGEGGYEGLVAIVDGLFSDHEHLTPYSWDLRGVIFDGGLPPLPE
jgi:hypothetical protein